MTTLILTVTALLVLAAIQTAGAGDARNAAKQLAVKYAELRTPAGAQTPDGAYPARVARSTPLRTHVARLP
jgi:hypothetical protein